MSEPVIIEAAINGATSKTVNPNVPVTEDEIVSDALACFEAGASLAIQVSRRCIVGDHLVEFSNAGMAFG